MTGLVSALLTNAFAGDVFFVETSGGAIMRFDGRDFSSSVEAWTRFQTMNPGLAVDASANTIWVYSPDFFDTLQSLDLSTSRWTDWGPQSIRSQALAFDPLASQLVGFGSSSPGMFGFPGANMLQSPGFRIYGADWFDDGGYIVAPDHQTGDFYGILANQNPMFLASGPGEIFAPTGPLGLAYDNDTRLFWHFHWGTGDVWMLEPETFSIVGHLFTPLNLDGAAGSFDTVPNQTPDLLFTGQCPGTAWVTIVDATPGGRVLVGSSTLLGAHTVVNGACAGAQLGLSNPRPRLDLVANSYGIASRRVEVTNPALCARFEHLQAIDVDTCLVTDVEERVMWLP